MNTRSCYIKDNFIGRVNYAAQCITRQTGIGGRTFDTCFEMNDGDAVVTALVRRAKKNERLAAAIKTCWRGQEPTQWLETAAKYAEVTDLPGLAQQLRDRADAATKKWMEELDAARLARAGRINVEAKSP